jgi:predicted nuclease of restriction endonuclease-like RecB superfamily|tara:strand:- start:148 stop:537 length:390 start_codon:yes stop_codon:yes gene_type:complete
MDLIIKDMSRRRKKLWSKSSVYTTIDGFEVKMDSTWEVAMAEKLDELNIRWVRNDDMKLEYTTVRGRKRKYIPDFYLPDHDLYIEVKGYWTDAARHKMKDIEERNPGKILILESLAEIAEVKQKLDSRK